MVRKITLGILIAMLVVGNAWIAYSVLRHYGLLTYLMVYSNN